MLLLFSSILLLATTGIAKPIFRPGGWGTPTWDTSPPSSSESATPADPELAGLVKSYDPATPLDIPGISVRSQSFTHKQDVHPSSNPVDLDSVFSRDLNGYYYEASTGSVQGETEPLSPIEIGNGTLADFMQESQTWSQKAYKAGAAPNVTDPHTYFRYSNAHLSFSVLVFEPHPYNWGDYADFAGWIVGLATTGVLKGVPYTIGSIGWRENDKIMKLAVTPSFGAVPYSNETAVTNTLTAHATRGGLRNDSVITLGTSTLHVSAGAATLPYKVLYSLISTAWDNAVIDLGNGTTYYQYNSGLDWLGAEYKGKVVDFEAVDGIAYDDLKKVLKALVQIAEKGGWLTKEGSRASVRAELLDKGGISVARFGFGTSAITKKIPCIALNPDGSQTAGCFVRGKA